MVFFIDEACSRPPPRLLTNVNKKMVFFIEGFPNLQCKLSCSSKFENFLQSECQTDQTQLSFHLQSLATMGARFGRIKLKELKKDSEISELLKR